MRKKIKVDVEILTELLMVGEQMSNICYNLSQPTRSAYDDVERNRSIMAELVRKWDASRNHLRSTM